MSVVYSEQVGTIRLAELNELASHIPPDVLTKRVLDIAIEVTGLKRDDVEELYEKITKHAEASRGEALKPPKSEEILIDKTNSVEPESVESTDGDESVTDTPNLEAREENQGRCIRGEDCVAFERTGAPTRLSSYGDRTICYPCEEALK